jgi:hypothetical protein
MWVLFHVPSPTSDGRTAGQIEYEPGEVAIVLEGDVGLVPLGGDE